MSSEEDLLANYKKAYDNRVGFGLRPALLLIDFCQAYFEPGNALYSEVDDAIASALRVRKAAREADVPVILTNVVYHPTGIDGGRFFEKAMPLKNFLKGSPMGAWGPGLAPFDDELVISKQYPSAFFGTSLASTLTAAGIDSVILTGLTTSGCIRASCIDSMSHGFKTAVVAEACGDRHAAPHDANLFDMNAKYADVVTEAETIAFLEGLRT
ncbi:isochorismatase family protein [Novosphingobium sp. Leaf2]|uniref:isochorismatase family protein n=1 Tax=Novosphingobium sp. Leaf2 TaxID=1735670 RepID=UPI0006FC1B77|nr:isochorismatase family protein [Novosphingobium sp. Leaf2]KQM19035.1 isochorismatase [Novosphingobium sp. Leaf2]